MEYKEILALDGNAIARKFDEKKMIYFESAAFFTPIYNPEMNINKTINDVMGRAKNPANWLVCAKRSGIFYTPEESSKRVVLGSPNSKILIPYINEYVPPGKLSANEFIKEIAGSRKIPDDVLDIMIMEYNNSKSPFETN